MQHEDYLEKLLDHPKPYQTELRDCAAFLASRLYVDKHGKTYMLLGQKDASEYWTRLYYGDTNSFTVEDKLLTHALETYFELGFDRKKASSDWASVSKMGNGSVWANVNRLATRMVVSKWIGSSWMYPVPYR